MNNLDEKIEIVKQQTEVKRDIYHNSLKAFWIGGLICSIAQVIKITIQYFRPLEDKILNTYTLIIMIIISSILTGLGIYDRIGQYAGCGSSIPITGFANSMTSAGLESKSEGLLLGIASNIFKLAGCVIVCGVVSGTIIAMIRYLGELYG